MNDFSSKYLGIMRQKGISISGKNFPDPISKERLNELVPRLRSGDNSVEKEIIEGHLRIGVFVVSKYAAKYPNKTDDLIGEMQLALTLAVKKYPEVSYDDNITLYLTATIHSKLQIFIRKEPVYIPDSTVRYFNKLDHKRKGQVIKRFPLFEEQKRDDWDLARNEQEGIVLSCEDPNLLEIKEILDKVTPDFVHKRIIELRAEGYTYEEIGPQVGYAKSRISIIVSSIEEKFNQLYA